MPWNAVPGLECATTAAHSAAKSPPSAILPRRPLAPGEVSGSSTISRVPNATRRISGSSRSSSAGVGTKLAGIWPLLGGAGFSLPSHQRRPRLHLELDIHIAALDGARVGSADRGQEC